MQNKLFFETIQYLDSLHEEGLLGRARTQELAEFSLELGSVQRSKIASIANDVSFKKIHSDDSDETHQIVSDILKNNWDSKD